LRDWESREIYNALRKPPFYERNEPSYYTISDWVDYPEEEEEDECEG